MKGLETLGERARYLMRVSDIKFDQISQITGKSHSTISTYLSGRTYPSEEFFFALKKLIPDINFHWLITGEGEMSLGATTPSASSDREVNMQHEIDELKTAQAYLLKSMSALSTTILDKQTPQDGRSFNPGVRETGRIIANFIEKYTAAHTPYVADGATA